MSLPIGSRNDYLGSNSTAVYPFTYQIREASDLRVVKRDTEDLESVLIINVDYTVSDSPWTYGGAITLTAGNLPTGYRLTIRRIRPLTQEIRLRNQAAFYPEVHEGGFDEARMVDQQLDDDIDRSAKLQESLPPGAFDPTIPVPVANAALIVNPAGTGWTWGTIIGTYVTTVVSMAATGVTYLQAGVGAIARTVQDRLRDRVDIKDFGGTGDGVTNDAPETVNAFAAHRAVRFTASEGDYLLADDVTIAVGKVLVVEAGARIKVDIGKTLTINGTVDAPLSHIFTGPGTVILGRKGKVPVTWFGALGLGGATDDVAAINRTVMAVRSQTVAANGLAQCGHVHVPQGVYNLSAPIDVNGCSGLQFVGDGHDTVLVHQADNEEPVLSLYGSRYSYFAGFQIQIDPDFPVDHAIVIEQPPTVSNLGISQTNKFFNILVEGNEVMENGVYLKGDVTDANNDSHTFEQVVFASYTSSGAFIQGVNALQIEFRDCVFAGFRVGNYGIKNLINFGFQTGSFRAYHCTFLGHLVADIYRNATCPVTPLVESCFSEGSEAFIIDSPGEPSGNSNGFTVRNCYWDTSQKSNTDPVVQADYPGPYLFEDCRFISFDTDTPVKFSWRGARGFAGPWSFTMQRCRIDTDLAYAAIFPDNLPTTVDIRVHRDDAVLATHDDHYVIVLPNNTLGIQARIASDEARRNIARITDTDIIQIGDEAAETHLQGNIIRTSVGITFPAIQGASDDPNTLDDYEEVEPWVPFFGGSGGQSGQTYDFQDAWAVKIGKRVDCGGRIKLTSLGTLTGDVFIGGLPYVAGGGFYSSFNCGLFLNLTTPLASLGGIIGTGETKMQLLGVAAAGGTDVLNIVEADFSDNTYLIFQATYFTSQ